MGVIEAVEAVNERQKEIVVLKLQQQLGSLKGKTIALWGLSFKPETDDMREAPALVVINKLIAEKLLLRYMIRLQWMSANVESEIR